MNYNNIVVLIPTYNPTDKLIKTIQNLKKNGFSNIIIVNDGSINDEVFFKIDVNKILAHESNRGKGYALKTGFNYLKKLKFDAVITMDDDLQQDIYDVKKIADAFLKNKGIYIGVRDFNGAPVVRKIANKISSILFRILYKENIKDTQTGLRCFPKDILSNLIDVKGAHFEYEMNVLKYLVKHKYKINEIYIKTIYNSNKSHYRAFNDSFKILKSMFHKD